MMYGEMPPPPKGSKRVCLLFRLCAMLLAAAASATVMAASGECKPSSGAAAFDYTSFRGFVILVWCSITAAILQAVAVYLQQSLSLGLSAADTDDDYRPVTDKQGIGAAAIVLVLVDVFVLALLSWGMAAAYTTAADHGDQMGGCARFAGQVELAEILSLAACVAATVAIAFRPRLKKYYVRIRVRARTCV